MNNARRANQDMAVVAGIDEAGLGPLIGPLVVSGTAFTVPREQLDSCLWKSLRDACTKKPRTKDRRLWVADSKAVYHAKSGLDQLERAVLVTLAWAERRPDSLRKLLNIVAPGATEALSAYPWYRDQDPALPLAETTGDIALHTNPVRRAARQNGVVFTGAFCEPLTAGAYNRMIDNTRNKSVVLQGLALRVMDRILKTSGDLPVRLYIDRLGGRMRYREMLMNGLNQRSIEIIEENESQSTYRMVLGHKTLDVVFTTSGDAKHFAVALASMYSKYLREVYMHCLNRYWSARVEGLRPTAGYYSDAKRWIEETRRKIDPDAPTLQRLIRTR